MPRTPTSAPDWDALYQLAEGQAGHFTVRQAATLGFSTPLILHHFHSGSLQRPHRGIYRLTRFPATDHEHLVVHWLWSEREGVFSHETALMLHGLSDALPEVVHLTLPMRWKSRRVRIPSGLRTHHADIPDSERTWFDCLPITTPRRTITDLVTDHADPVIVDQATKQGVQRGLFTRKDIRSALRDRGRG